MVERLALRHRRERRVLARAARLDAPDPEALRALAAGGLDWGYLVERARRSAVLPALAYALRQGALLELVPQPARDALEDEAQKVAVHNALLLRDLASAVGALDAEGVRSVALKGSALLASYYPTPAARHTDDVDLLVAAGDHPRAARVLARLGYQEKRTPLRPDGKPAGDHHSAHVSPSGTVLELHRAVPHAGDRLGDLEALLARSERVTVHGVPVAIPGPGDLLGGLCVHVVRYHRLQLRYLARHRVDVALVLASGRVTDGALDELRADPQTKLPLQLSLGLVQDRAGAPEALVQALLFPTQALANLSLLSGAALESLGEDGLRGTWFNLFPARRHMVEEWGAPDDLMGLLPHYPRRLLKLLAHLVPGR